MDMKKFLKKNLRLWNFWSEFEMISQDCILCDPFQKLFAKLRSVKKNGCHWGGGFFHRVDFREILQNSSLKPPVRFWNNFTGLFHGWLFSKIVREILIRRKKHGRHGGGGDFWHYMDMKKFLKNLLLWNPWSDFEIISRGMFLGWPFQKFFAKFWSVEKHGCHGRETFCTIWTWRNS